MSQSKQQYIFFFSSSHPFSQWYKSDFTETTKNDEKIIYKNCETYMMAKKALLFGDMEIYNQILSSTNPKKVKELGRKVKNFDGNKWKKYREDIVYNGNFMKFSQNPRLKNILLQTGNDIIVEASPWDKIWGVGEDESTLRTKLKDNPEYKFRGLNLLGKALMCVRENLRE